MGQGNPAAAPALQLLGWDIHWGVPSPQSCVCWRLAPPSDWMEEMVVTIYCPVGVWIFSACFSFCRKLEKRIATGRETGTASVSTLSIFSVLFDAAFLDTATTELSNACPGALQGILVLFSLSLTAHHPNPLQVA